MTTAIKHKIPESIFLLPSNTIPRDWDNGKEVFVYVDEDCKRSVLSQAIKFLKLEVTPIKTKHPKRFYIDGNGSVFRLNAKKMVATYQPKPSKIIDAIQSAVK